MRLPFTCAALALALAVMPSSPALAQAEPDARAAFDAGRKAMQAKHWTEAHEIFLELWGRQHTYDVALHLGQIEYHLKRFREAAGHLAYGLILLPPREKPEIAERSRALLEMCKAEIGTLELRVRNRNATVLVDGAITAEAPLVADLYVEPGNHQFEVRLDGHTSERWDSSFVRGTTQQRIVELKPQPVAAPIAVLTPVMPEPRPPTAPAPKSAVEASTPAPSWLPVIAGGALTLVGVGAGVGFQLLRDTREDQARVLLDRLGEDGCSTPSENLKLCQQLSERNGDYDTYGKLELVSFVVAGSALGLTSVYFLLTRPDRTVQTRQSALGRLRFDPVLAPTFGALFLSGSY